MTDISVIKMIISVAVWRIYPSWVNDKLWAWEGLGHSRMFWARLPRDDFRSKLEIISFPSRVMSVSKSFYVSRAFERFGAKRSSSGAFGFDDVLEVFLKTPLRHRAFFANSVHDHGYFLKVSFLFSKEEPVLLAWQLWWSPGWALWWLMVRRKLEWKLYFRALARSTAEGPSIIVAIGRPTSRVRWSMVHKRKKIQGNQRVIERSLNPSSSTNQRVLRNLFPRLGVATVLHFAVILYVDVQLQDGQAAARESEKSSHPWHFRCWLLKRNELECTDLVHCTVFRHVMQLSSLVLC